MAKKYGDKCGTTKDNSQAMANAKAAEVKNAQGGTSGGSGKAPKSTGRGY